MEISLHTPEFTLVPSQFFSEESARELLSEVVVPSGSSEVAFVRVPQYDAVLVYHPGGNYPRTTVSYGVSEGSAFSVLPEMYYMLRDLPSCKDYNKILASYREGCLLLAIAQGNNLLLCNSYRACDFTTAEYFIFLAMKSLQLNPEVSVISFRESPGAEEEMSLYRYFKSVETIQANADNRR